MKNTIIVILVLAVLGLGGYKMYIWKTQPYTEYGDYVIKSEQDNSFTTKPVSVTPTDETKDWKTHTQNLCGFTFKYPKEFVSSPEANYKLVPETAIGYVLTNSPDPSDVYGGITLIVGCYTKERRAYDPGQNYTLYGFTNNNSWWGNDRGPSKEVVAMGGKGARYDYVLPEYAPSSTEIIGYRKTTKIGIEKNDGNFVLLNFYSALLPDSNSAQSADLSIADEILSTSRFTK